VIPGEIYRHEAFYADEETGELRRKYFAVMASLAGGDFVGRLLTSRPHGRPEDPRYFPGALDRHALMSLLECAAAADDTTQLQERAMRDQLATMR